MRIKKFVGQDIKTLTEQMKKELGPDAIVLNTRRRSQGGMLGPLGKEMIEITAAIDEEVSVGKSTYSAPLQNRGEGASEDSFESLLKKSGIEVTPGNAHSHASETYEGLQKMAGRFDRRSTENPRELPSDAKEFAEIYHLKSEVADIKSSLSEIAHEIKYKHSPSLPEHLKRVYATLIDNDVNENVAAELTQAVYKTLPLTELEKKETIDRHVVETIAGLVKTGLQVKPKSKRPKIIALVGPTGVGKTTTIAKLAAIQKLVNHVSVGLITADTYRIGAIEQLRTFATIADIPMEVVYRPADMPQALKKFAKKDIVFVDTVGRNQRSKKDLAELKKFVEAAKPDEIHLVLSASASSKTLADVAERFKSLQPNNLIFSKIDEAVTFGPLFNIVQKQKLNVSYLTTGQAVPDDILPADGIKFASLIYENAVPNA
jgi:flagellar biosynthesis protein FlhF